MHTHTHTIQGGFLDSFVQLANDYPYMWALYAVAVALPFVLCACCCVRSKPSKKDEAAERKKTDAPSPDDPKAKKEDEQSKSEEKKMKEGEESQKKKGEEAESESPVEEQAEVSFTSVKN